MQYSSPKEVRQHLNERRRAAIIRVKRQRRRDWEHEHANWEYEHAIQALEDQAERYAEEKLPPQKGGHKRGEHSDPTLRAVLTGVLPQGGGLEDVTGKISEFTTTGKNTTRYKGAR